MTATLTDTGAPAELDAYRLLTLMTLDAPADRVGSDVQSARGGGIRTAPAIFVNDRWYTGPLAAEAIWAAVSA